MDYRNNLCLGCFSDKGSRKRCPACGYEEKSLEASLYLPPRTILAEKYITGKVLGQGGFGITYLGWDLNLETKLAIKEFFPQGLVSRLSGQSKVISFTEAEGNSFDYWLARFLREARTLAQFEQHPNIVSVRDFFKSNNTAYMIMSYVEGTTLEQYLAQAGGKLPYDKAIEVMMPVMDALREVHEVGVMHRDISPDNIFIDNKGRVVLIDFGAARQEIRDQSKSLSVILKAGYAPEEQYRARGKQGPWTDVYAVGATLYRCLTGETPPEAIDRLAEDTIVTPSQKGVAISSEKEDHLFKAMAVRAKDRYQTVEDFQEALLEQKLKPVASAADKQKACPDCGKKISAKAIKCKYCQSLFEEPLPLANSGSGAEIEKPPLEASVGPDKVQPMGTGDNFKGRSHLYGAEMVDLDCPVELVSFSIDPAKGKSETYAMLTFRNLSGQKLKALRFKVFCFDPFGEPVNYKGSNSFEKTLMDLSAQPGALFGGNDRIPLHSFADTREIEVLITGVSFGQNRRWEYNGSEVYEVVTELLEGEELARLQEAAGEDALCYAHEEENYWQCLCGRANLSDVLKCLRCARNKAETLKNLSSEKRVSVLLEKHYLEKEAAELRRQEEREAEEQRLQEERKRKAEEAEQKRRLALQKAKRMGAVAAGLLVVITAAVLVYQNMIQPAYTYSRGVRLMETGTYVEAVAIFEQLGGYRDAEEMLMESNYNHAESLFEAGKYTDAAAIFKQLTDYSDAEEMLFLILLAKTNADYYIDYTGGTIPLGDLPIGTRVADPSWEWEFRTESNYSGSGAVKPVTWIVAAKDHYDSLGPHVTLLAEELIGRFAFDNSTNRGSRSGSNHWGDSGTANTTFGLRPWLNSTGIHSGEGFYRAFSDSFKGALLIATVPNKEWQNGNAYSTQDRVFLPSTTELGDTAHSFTHQIGTVYPYFQSVANSKRAARIGEKTSLYWTRSPASLFGGSVRYVSYVGEFNNVSANQGGRAVRPALNLKSDTMVSEMKH